VAAVVALILALWLVRPAYAPAPTLVMLPPHAIPVGAQFGERIVLEGVSIPGEVLAPGEVAHLTLYWRLLEPSNEELAVGVKLFGRDEQLLARADSYPDGGRAPTSGWPVGVLIPDRTILLLSDEAVVPTVASLEIDLFHPARMEPLPIIVDDNRPIRPFRPVRLLVRAQGATPAPHEDFVVRPVAPQVTVAGNRARIDFQWEVGRPLDRDYQGFFHLVEQVGQPPLAQEDFAPLGSAYPSSVWAPGERLTDQAAIDLPRELVPGDYQLLLGLYDLATGQRFEYDEGLNSWPIAQLRWDGHLWQALP
jgi:hypothetical protein